MAKSIISINATERAIEIINDKKVKGENVSEFVSKCVENSVIQPTKEPPKAEIVRLIK